MPKALRVALPILLVLAVYSPFVAAGFGLFDFEESVLLIWVALVIGLGTANVANACLDNAEGNLRRLALIDMFAKLLMVPFFLLVFLAGLALFVGMLVAPGAVFGIPVLVGALAAVDYILLLFTSAYGFSAIVRARNQRLLPSGTTAVLVVLHALFVADVIAAIVLYLKIRKATKAISVGAIGA